MTATKSWGPTPAEQVGTEVDYQVAAPLKREHPTGTERISLTKECGWKDGDRGGPVQTQNPLVRKRKTDLTLTGLLMEGLGQFTRRSCVCSSGRIVVSKEKEAYDALLREAKACPTGLEKLLNKSK